MESYVLPIFFSLNLMLVATHAAIPPEVYWKRMLPRTSMPKAITELLISRGGVSTGHMEKPAYDDQNAHIVKWGQSVDTKTQFANLIYKWTHAAMETKLEGLAPPLFWNWLLAAEETESQNQVPFFYGVKKTQSQGQIPFLYGAKETKSQEQIPFLYGAKETQSQEHVPFLYGAKETESQNQVPFFYGAKETQSQGQIPFLYGAKETQSQEQVPFLYGAKETQSQEQIPFLYGAKETESQNQVPFFYGAKETQSQGQIPFLYGAKETQSQEQIPFLYGAKSQEQIPFLYGAKETQSQDQVPFLYGAKSQEQIPFLYGAKETQSQDQIPFLYGAKSQGQIPFLYGAKSQEQVPFLYGAKETQSQEQVPFLYGAKETQSQDQIPFLYGAKEIQSQNQVPFLYGGKKTQSHDHPSAADLFFLEEDLRPGTKKSLHFSKNKYAAPFLPRQITEPIPFSSDKMKEILNKFSVEPKSMNARIIEKAIAFCEAATIEGEEKYCATSLESLVDFITSKLGKNVHAISTEVDNEMKSQNFSLKHVKKLADDKVIACHRMTYPYAVFLCHKLLMTSAYYVPLEGEDGVRVNSVAVCHRDTSKWNPEHMAFKALKVKPGTAPVCHFSPEDTVVWFPK